MAPWLLAFGLALVTAWTVNLTGSLSGAVGSVTGNVGGNVVGSIGSLGCDLRCNYKVFSLKIGVFKWYVKECLLYFFD
jgi:hypothetical protein